MKHAVAAQAGFIALRDSGGDAHAHVREVAGRGVVAHSGGGVSETIDRRVASHAWADLCVEAQDLLARFVTAAFGTI